MASIHYKKRDGVWYLIDRKKWIRLGPIRQQEAKKVLLKYETDKTYLKLDMVYDHAMTFRELADEYLEKLEAIRYRTLETRKIILKRICETFGKTPIGKINPHDVDVWFKKMEYKPRTVVQYLDAFKQSYKLAIEKKYLTDYPLRSFKRPKIPHAIPRYESPENIATVLKAMTPEARLPYYIMFYTGLRPSTVARMKVGSVDLGKRVILPEHEDVKTHEAHVVEMSDEVYPYFRKLVKGRGKDEYLFPSKTGGQRGNFRSALRRAETKTGIKITPYQFRHSFGTGILNQTGDLRLTQEVMGHKDIRSTLVYAYTLRDRKKAAINKWSLKPKL